jgi:D-serine dehydratase
MQRLVDGYYTVSDEEMYALLVLMERSEGLRLEPSALAGVPGIARVHGDRQGYLARAGLDGRAMAQATHLAWATGGNMVPPDEMQTYLDKGRRLLEKK